MSLIDDQTNLTIGTEMNDTSRIVNQWRRGRREKGERKGERQESIMGNIKKKGKEKKKKQKGPHSAMEEGEFRTKMVSEVD